MTIEAPPLVARCENLGPPEEFTPTIFGPVWETDEEGSWLLPENSLGWGLIAFAAKWLRGADGERGWRFTLEQARWLLWFYAIDRRGRWVYSEGVIQMVKGWGKDPLGAVVCALELIGPVRFSHWVDRNGRRLTAWQEGAQAVGKRQAREPWIQITGVAREQTKNTMSFLQGLFTDEAKAEWNIEVNKEIIYAHGGQGRIEVITSAPRTMEGNRPSFAIRGEPHHWVSSNGGHDFNKVLRRNITKMRSTKGSRTLALTNAYNPAEESVLQKEREAYEVAVARGTSRTFWYSVEAPEDVLLFPDYTRLDENGDRIVEYDEHDQMIPPSVDTIIAHLSRILRVLGGDATWLSPEETVEEIMRPDSDLSEMRRFYLNSVVSGTDTYLVDADLAATIHPDLKALREANEAGDVLRLGWSIVGRDDPIVMFFDGSKSGDSTALVGCRVSDGYIFLIGLWQQPPGDRGRAWLAPREEIDGRVKEAEETFNIVAFWADPSHAKDDQDGTRYWDVLIDRWHGRMSDKIQPNLWAVQTGERMSAIMWDMATPAHQDLFSQAVVRFGDDMDAQLVLWDGHPGLRSHLRNARKFWSSHGLVIRKPARGSTRKIDAAVCAIGASMLARLVKIKGLETPGKAPGSVWYTKRGRHG